MIQPPYYPIVYVRGYAGTQGEVEETVATPYMGFNLGSTKFRQSDRKEEILPWVFESPLLRLMKDHGYVDAYRDGELRPSGPVPSRSIWIFRYYDVTSRDLGRGKREEIEIHARRLREFILHIRDAVLEKGEPRDRFRVHLVAHSMGGLVCRGYLQNDEIPDLRGRRSIKATHKGVDKLFTYATPHGGIEFRKGLGWAEGLRDFLDVNNSGNFGPRRMRRFLKLGSRTDLRSLAGRFPEERVFSLVGTDSRDYGAAAGLSRRSVGPISDGLVQIANAYVAGAPRAFVHRSHSGHYGIVNSEEGYQNLQRFLFGETRVDLLLDRVKTRLPKGKKIDATYYVETVISIRGIPVEVHRRTTDTESAIFRSRDRLETGSSHLHTAYLASGQRVNRRRNSVGFQVRLRVVPQYHVDRRWLRDDHYEGAAILDDALTLELRPARGDERQARYGWASEGPDTPHRIDWRRSRTAGALVGEVPFKRAMIRGRLVLRVRPWNADPTGG